MISKLMPVLFRAVWRAIIELFRKAYPPKALARGRKQPPFQPSHRRREKLFPMF